MPRDTALVLVLPSSDGETRMKRSAPMKRTGFARKEPKPFALADRKTTLRRRAKKPTVAEGSKYLAACRGEQCYLRVVCGGEASPDIVVPAHRNEGKGMGLKVSNELTLPACHWCHVEYDQGKLFTREEKRGMWDQGYTEWEPVRARKMNKDAA
jgi:hypothetical protein